MDRRWVGLWSKTGREAECLRRCQDEKMTLRTLGSVQAPMPPELEQWFGNCPRCVNYPVYGGSETKWFKDNFSPKHFLPHIQVLRLQVLDLIKRDPSAYLSGASNGSAGEESACSTGDEVRSSWSGRP